MYWLSCFSGALGLFCCARVCVAVSGRGERGLPFLAVHRPRCCASRGVPAPRCEGVSGFGTQGQLLRGRWGLPGPGVKSVSPALQGQLLTREAPEQNF